MSYEIAVQKGNRPHIRFEMRPAEDRAASIEAGHKVYKDIVWVIITPPGGKDVVENHAEQWLKNIQDRAEVGQYDPEWVASFRKMYQMYRDGLEMPEDGTPLRMCTTLFSPAEIQNCLGANVTSLEQLAAANEEALGRIGMGARALKLRAEEAVKLGEGKEGAMKVEALTIENAELKDKVAALTDIVHEMRQQMATMQTPAEKPSAAKKQPA